MLMFENSLYMYFVDLEPYWHIIMAFEIWSSQREKHWRQGIFIIVRFFQESLYGITVHLRYDVTGQELTDWPKTLSWLAVTNTG